MTSANDWTSRAVLTRLAALSVPSYPQSVTATPPYDPEFELLAAATARPAGRRHTGAIAAAVARRIDWSRFLKLVARHRIAPLALDGLACVRGAVPEDVHRDLRTAALRDRASALQMVGVLATITARLSAGGIDAISIKGPTLALLAFGDASLRQSRDLDILISSQHVGRALAILRPDCRLIHPAGFDAPDLLRRWAQVMKDVSLLHEPTGTIIELHWRLNDNPHLLPVAVATSRRTVTFGSIAVETLAPDDLLLYLCVHGATHYWFRLKWLADVHALLANRGAEAIEQFHDHACAHGLEVPAGQMLSLLEQVYGMAIPRAIATSIAESWQVRWSARLARRFLQDIEEPERVRFATTVMALGHLLLRRSPRYAAREAAGLLIDWPVAINLGGSRWACFVAIIGRPVFWIVRKAKVRRSVAA